MTGLWNIVATISWPSVALGAITGMLTLAARSILQAPMKSLTEHSMVIRVLAFLSPQGALRGTWDVTWRVDSTRFHPENSDRVRVYRLFSNVTFTTTAKLKDGKTERCVFVGKLLDKTITGRWFNPKDQERGYFGTYQVRLHGSLEEARGAWVGWANDGSVQSNEMALIKVAE